MVAASLPFFRGASLTNIFFVRDLTMFFWPRHLWLRGRLLSGVWPLWDPYAAGGQAVFPDALNQMFLPPVLLLRLLLPAVVGFNLIVIAPFPLAALGMWLFLRRRVTAPAATLGAILFAVGGPVVSTANFPNLSWSAAAMPWVFWALDADRARPTRRTLAVLALAIAFQVLAGEPVTLVATMGLLAAYVIVDADETQRPRLKQLQRLATAMALGAALSAVQSIPMTIAAQRSVRGLLRPDNFWSLHPLALAESLLPRVFGLDFAGTSAQQPWIKPLNSDRDPFFYSLYSGPIALLAGAVGAWCGRHRWRMFWSVVAAGGLLCAFGDYTPVYPAIQRILPIVRTFRFPVKFLLLTSFAVATLAAHGVEAQADASSRRNRALLVAFGAIAIALVTLSGLVMVAPFAGARTFFAVGSQIGVKDPIAGAEFLFHSIPPSASRVLLVLVVGGALTYVGWRQTREAAIARAALIAVAAIDLISVNAALNPVFPASRLGPPPWTAALAAHPADRFYFGGKFRGSLVSTDPDLQAQRLMLPPPDLTLEEWRTKVDATLALTPAAWRVRELLSYDLPALWPLEVPWMETLFENADRPTRLRVLQRGGVRYCLLATPPSPEAKPLHRVGDEFGDMAVYDCVPGARRAFVAPRAEVFADVSKQLAQLFSPTLDADTTAVIEHTVAAAGRIGEAASPSANIVEDGDVRVVVDASAGADGGYLVLLDSYDRAWSATVDGEPAEIVRANALFRAVRLNAGSHRVTFTYRPVALYGSAAISLFSLLIVAFLAVPRPREASPATPASAARETPRPAKKARGR